MPLHIIFLTDEPGIMAVRMLWFEVLPPFELYNQIRKTRYNEDDIDVENQMANRNNRDYKEVLRFQAEFVDIDKLTEKLSNKTITMQKYFNHPNAEIQYKENDEDPLSVVYFEVNLRFDNDTVTG